MEATSVAKILDGKLIKGEEYPLIKNWSIH